MNYKPIYEYFLDAVQKSFNRTALKYKKDGKYRDITYAELSRAIDEVANGLSALGIGKGDRVAIFSYNRPEWVMCDMAALKLGAVVVPVYHTLPASAVAYILRDSEARLIFVENQDLFNVVQEAISEEIQPPTNADGRRPESGPEDHVGVSRRGSAVRLKHVVTFFDTEPSRQEEVEVKVKEEKQSSPLPLPLPFEVETFANLRRNGSAIISRAEQKALPAVDAQDLATVVYTSGTMGEPKGAMLTHANIMSNALAANEMFNINSEDVLVSFLPLCHAFERTCGYYTFISAGGTIAYVESLQTVAADVREIRPTILISVPRMIEKVYEVVQNKVEAGSAIKRWMAVSALRTYGRITRLKDQGKPIPWVLRMRRNVFKSLVVDKFHEITGGRVRVIMSGGAPLGRRLAHILHNLEFDVSEGYGLTEASPVVAAAPPERFKLGTVGIPLPGVEVKIGEQSEVLVRGPNVMRGYLNKPEETAKVIDSDGWLHTGDQGQLDADGYLTITGRIKELIVTSYGKNVAPVPIETEIMSSQYVEQVMVYGDRCSYLTAIVVPRREVVEAYARTHGIKADSFPELLRNERIRKLVEGDVVAKTAGLAPFEQVKAAILSPEPFTVENEMMTVTLKLRRNKIVERWRKELGSLYQGRAREKQ
jgi:long-chain acyl-CoA synthetase